MSEYMEGYEAAKEEYRPRLIEAEDEIERLRSLLERARHRVQAECAEYEAAVAAAKRLGMAPEAYEYGEKQIEEIASLLAEIDKE